MADVIKFIIAGLILAAGLTGFYMFEDQIMPLRVLGILLSAVLAGVVASRTATGAGAVAYSRGALLEMRKVVWPTRRETTQTTLLVAAMVVLVGIILWLFDMFLVWGIQLLTGQGG